MNERPQYSIKSLRQPINYRRCIFWRDALSGYHFYLTFNPFLNTNLDGEYTQAHEFHDFLKSLLTNEKSQHAYWGKIIGKDRECKVEFEKFEKVIAHNKEENLSTHLYISDFKNLWVAKVESVHDKITKNEMKHALPFYEGKNVEVWFKVTDFTLLEFEGQETANKLSELFIDNEFVENKIQGLSPFTTSIRYPTIVQDLAEENYFDEIEEGVTHLVLKGHHALNSTSATQVLKALHAYAFPESLYHKIPHAAKVEIESAEMDILENRHHNMGRIAFAYLKSLEIIINDLTIHHIKRCGYGDEFYVDIDHTPPRLLTEPNNSTCVTLSKYQKNFSIGHLMYFLQGLSHSSNFCFRKAFQNKKPFVNFLTKELDRILSDNQLIDVRNMLAHQGAQLLSPNDAMAIRNLMLGIGCHGLIHRIYQCFYNEQFKFLARLEGKYNADKKKKAA
jgi:hypothetical protein